MRVKLPQMPLAQRLISLTLVLSSCLDPDLEVPGDVGNQGMLPSPVVFLRSQLLIAFLSYRSELQWSLVRGNDCRTSIPPPPILHYVKLSVRPQPSTATHQCLEMEGMKRINQICDEFAARLQKLRVRNHEEQPFYPNGTAKEVFRMDEEQLHELFQLISPGGTSKDGIISAIVRHVVRNLSTLFAVVVRIRRAGDVNLLRQFTDLIVHDDTLLQPPRLTDDELPIPLDKARLFFPTFANEFFDTQFQFCAITLQRKEDVTYQDYRSQCPLPYKRQQRIGGGAFGEVYKVKIERHHVRSTGDRSGNLEPEWLARKDFKRQQSFTVELDVYKAIMKQPRKHDHLVMVVAILQYRDTSSLFFPLATGDLDQYLNGKLHGDERPLDTLQKKSMLFERGVALAGALAFLHDGFDGVACLHLDLKPSNVLVYDAYAPDETWKITDFGLTRVRNREYSSAAPGFEGIYLPPECGTPDGRVTPRSDVWSLGCIFSLVITYMLCGPSGVKKFTEKRGERPEGDLFFITTKNSTPRISPAVTSWFDHLKQSSARDETLSRVIRESLDYLQSKVLHPICGQRATAREVELGLKAIHQRFEKRAPPPSPQPSQGQPEQASVIDRLIARMKHRTSESSVFRLRSFGYNLNPNGFGFRFSPLDGDYLAFFSSQNTLFWTVSEIMSALRDGSQIPPPQALRIPDGATKSFAVSSNTICNCLDAESFKVCCCVISSIFLAIANYLVSRI